MNIEVKNAENTIDYLRSMKVLEQRVKDEDNCEVTRKDIQRSLHLPVEFLGFEEVEEDLKVEGFIGDMKKTIEKEVVSIQLGGCRHDPAVALAEARAAELERRLEQSKRDRCVVCD